MNTKYVTTKGALTDMNLSRIGMDVESVLERIGKEAASEMKEHTRPFNYKGDLTDSITWRTNATYAPIPNSDHLIDVPDTPHTVDVGSKAPHAWFREHGTRPHTSPEGSAEFVAAIREWAASKGMGKKDADSIIFHIRTEGTVKHPFAEPMRPRMPVIAMKHFSEWAHAMFNRAGI